MATTSDLPSKRIGSARQRSATARVTSAQRVPVGNDGGTIQVSEVRDFLESSGNVQFRHQPTLQQNFSQIQRFALLVGHHILQVIQ